MKKREVTFIVFLFAMFFAGQTWAHGIGGFSLGGHAGGFQGGSGHFDHFQHEQFFGPHHHFGPFVPFGHERHFDHEQFFGPHHHFGQDRFAFHSFGFSGGGFFFDNGFGPAGPPPLGAPGPPPLGAPGRVPFIPLGPPVVVISSPFFCFPHGLGFTDQTLFLDHLRQFHGIPSSNALSRCMPIGGGLRWIFFGF